MIIRSRHQNAPFGALGDWNVAEWYDDSSAEGKWCNQNYPYDHSQGSGTPGNGANIRCRTRRLNWQLAFSAPWTVLGRNQRSLPSSVTGSIDQKSNDLVNWIASLNSEQLEVLRLARVYWQDPNPENLASLDAKLAPLLPWPFDTTVGGLPKLIRCARDEGNYYGGRPYDSSRPIDKGALASCAATYLVEMNLELLSSPEFRVVMDVMTGNVPGALVDAARLGAKKIIDYLKTPQAAHDLKVGREDIDHIAAMLAVLTKSPEFIMALVTEGPGVVKWPYFYQIIGGVVSAAGDKGSLISDIGWVIGDNSVIFATMAQDRGYSARVDDLVTKKYIDPIKKRISDPIEMAKRGDVIQAAGNAISGIGTMIARIGQEMAKIPKVNQYLGGIAAAGVSMAEIGVKFAKFGTTLTGKKIDLDPDWRSLTEKLKAEIEALKKERDALKLRLAAGQGGGGAAGGSGVGGGPGGGPGAPPPPLTKGGRFNAAGAAAGAGAGLLLGGPVGAGAGALIGGLVIKPKGGK